MSTARRFAAAALAVAALAACGHKRDAAPAAPQAPITATNDSGLKASVTVVKERSKSLALTLALENTGKQAIQFKNPVSLRVPGFAVAADGREPIGADGGKIESKRSAAARMKELGPGAKAQFEVTYTFDPALAHESYPWTLTVGNLYAGEQKLGDLTLTYSPTPAH